ncbi:MAG: amidohydrolase family protein [Spirochaetales bacterium]|nr:amidohydrolase family protein [Spirochaetales bacterium]
MSTPQLDKAFFDCHVHLYNLSHAGFLAYINRLLLNKSISINDLIKNKFLKIIIRIFSSDSMIWDILKKIILIIILLGISAAGFLFGKLFLLDYFLKSSSMSLTAKIIISIFITLILLIVTVFLLIRVSLLFKTRKIFNTLSIAENDIAGMLFYLELDYLILLLEKKSESDNDVKDKLAEIKNKVKHNRMSPEKAREEYIQLIKDTFKSGKKTESYNFHAGNMDFNKVILAPLMMDFKGKGYEGSEKIYYNMPPQKQIVEQVVDVFNGMKRYNSKSEFKIFEIYPFMGINTHNYDYRESAIFRAEKNSLTEKLIKKLSASKDKVKGKFGIFKENNAGILLPIEELDSDDEKVLTSYLGRGKKNDSKALIQKIAEESKENSIQKLLYKYFGDYSGDSDLYNKFSDNYKKNFIEGHYDGNIDKIRSFFFAGIKLYPPLGFNPWPEEKNQLSWKNQGKKEEYAQEKVEFIYSFCVKRNIPLTVHCQKTSFATIDVATKDNYTSPEKWDNVLKKNSYENLKINFAHFGLSDKEYSITLNNWTRHIINNHLAKPNVYADFAAKGMKRLSYNFYKNFRKIIDSYKVDMTKILFGSDFPLSLFQDNSYKDYIEFFFNNPCFDDEQRKQMYNINPGKFLFHIE